MATTVTITMADEEKNGYDIENVDKVEIGHNFTFLKNSSGKTLAIVPTHVFVLISESDDITNPAGFACSTSDEDPNTKMK